MDFFFRSKKFRCTFIDMFMIFMTLKNECLCDDDCHNCFAISQYYNHHNGNHYQSYPISVINNPDQRQYESSVNYQYMHPSQNDGGTLNYGHHHHHHQNYQQQLQSQQQQQQPQQPQQQQQIHSSLLSKPLPPPPQPPPPQYRPIIMAYHPR